MWEIVLSKLFKYYLLHTQRLSQIAGILSLNYCHTCRTYFEEDFAGLDFSFFFLIYIGRCVLFILNSNDVKVYTVVS